ncbi:carbohydrate binding protein with CBM9 domain [Prosthecobacter fusiformis]|uniref:Carbohydrate binding protein with CBM9 domain n=1 Tax=Prosthecobacter fusiformis TaxID=48464 RepID=A0A4R7RY88_9BACT|nr:sugar-binding protein [Prosthecobacter fusiformis]TDU70904.1 carbohydrate binding protein with CBM9 domain [Prosthecobacter fusiformis]
MTAENAPLPRFQVHRRDPSNVNWNQATWIEDFQFPWEATPPPSTKFCAQWSHDSLHFCFRCVDKDLVLGEGETLKERVLGSDRVEVFFAPDLTLDPYYAFEISPRGEALAYRAKHYRQFDWEWSCPELKVEAQVEAQTYSVQGTLPMSVLRDLNILKPGATEFYAGVFRAEFSHKPDGSIHSGWMPWVNPQTERPDFHVPSAFGVFELVG